MGWYPGIIGSTTSGGGVDLVALCAGSSGFDVNDTLTSSTVIPSYLFQNQSKVRNVNLSRVVLVDENAFAGSGRDVSVDGRVSINLPSCTEIKANGFSGFKAIKNENTLNLTSCTKLGERAFGNSYSTFGLGFEVVNLPKIETIGNYCFQNGAFGTVNIGSYCTSFGNKIFISATVSTLYCEASTPPNITSGTELAFGSIGTIYVPQNSVSAYQTATGWSQYANKIQPIIIEG